MKKPQSTNLMDYYQTKQGKTMDFLLDLDLLLNGCIEPHVVIGERDVVLPKQFASQWLRLMAHRANGKHVDEVHILPSGQALSSIHDAQQFFDQAQTIQEAICDMPYVNVDVDIVPELDGDGFEVHLIVIPD